MPVEVAQAASWQNPRLAPRLERLAALVYADGGSLAEDRDGHVRSASALRDRDGDVEAVLVRPDRAPQIKPAAAFYRALRSIREFAGPALNIEGAVCHGDRVRLFQRGNGASDGAPSVNAVGDLPLDGFLAWLDAGGPVPQLLSILQVDLGRIEGSCMDSPTALS